MGLFSRRKRAPTDDPTLVGFGGDAPEEELEEPEPLDLGPEPLEAFEMLVDREWERLAAPGTWWTGAERIAIAADARRAMAGEALSGILPPPVEEATRIIATAAASIRGTDVARWELDGLDASAYIEIAGIVSRLAALDVTAFGLGHKFRPLPEPEPGDPSRDRPDGATITTGWAPTIGPAAASSALSAVPAEAEAMADVRDVLYLGAVQMLQTQSGRDGLTRPQIELAASRASALNDCFHCLLGQTSMLHETIDAAPGARTSRPIITGCGDAGVEHGAEIIAFVDSVVLFDDDEVDAARAALEHRIGPVATDRVAMVAGSFSMTSRAVDAIGAPVGRGHDELADELGVAIPAHLAPR
ncbi:MAG: alkylhydroperoxidase-related (seleno)protein [Acidimicrobiales bacterium]